MVTIHGVMELGFFRVENKIKFGILEQFCEVSNTARTQHIAKINLVYLAFITSMRTFEMYHF